MMAIVLTTSLMEERTRVMKTIRIGAGAGYAGDRVEPASELAQKGDLDYLVFECLAERTIALAHQARLQDPAAGYDLLLPERMKAVLRPCAARGTRIITNMGAAESDWCGGENAGDCPIAGARASQDCGRHRR